MSRLAKNPIAIPAGITLTIADGVVTVKGPKGELTRSYKTEIIEITQVESTVVLTLLRENLLARSLWGTYASHITNMFMGVTEGYIKKLIVEGVGFRWALSGKTLEMQLGFSHPVHMDVPEGLDIVIEKSTLSVSGIDKEKVGLFAANIRAKKKPEPYKGKGIRYAGEIIRRKQGKKTV
ncbi:MAG: large subunit ribosomal protein L6 [Planctomycetota bacterium]|jgi:large subunit ribosomal protein L6